MDKIYNEKRTWNEVKGGILKSAFLETRIRERISKNYRKVAFFVAVKIQFYEGLR